MEACRGIAAGSLLVLAFLCYFIPAIVASKRKHRQMEAIFLLNLLLGWTLVGWAGALVWACVAEPVVQPRFQTAEPAITPQRLRVPCPQCSEAILPTAKLCPFCKSVLEQ